MKRILLLGATFVVAVYLLIFLIGKVFIDSAKEEAKKYESKIGDKFVLGKDTLIIIDCSMLGESYTLSNGVKINYKLVK